MRLIATTVTVITVFLLAGIACAFISAFFESLARVFAGYEAYAMIALGLAPYVFIVGMAVRDELERRGWF